MHKTEVLRGHVLRSCDQHADPQSEKNLEVVSDNCFFLFSARRFERAIRKRPNTVKCLAVKCTLLGTRHPREEKEELLLQIYLLKLVEISQKLAANLRKRSWHKTGTMFFSDGNEFCSDHGHPRSL